MFAEIAAGGMAAIHLGRLRGPTELPRTGVALILITPPRGCAFAQATA
jgi:hypothetical protein